MRCEHCGGSLLDEPDGKRPRRVCLSCGREAPVPEFIRHDADWKAMAMEDLKEKIAQVQAVESIKLEAERTWAAQSAAQVQGVPELPWKAKPKHAGGRRKREQTNGVAAAVA